MPRANGKRRLRNIITNSLVRDAWLCAWDVYYMVSCVGRNTLRNMSIYLFNLCNSIHANTLNAPRTLCVESLRRAAVLGGREHYAYTSLAFYHFCIKLLTYFSS